MAIALRQLAYGIPADACDELFGMSESTCRDIFLCFCASIVEIFKDEYLRLPNAADVSRLLLENGERGFPGMLGSIDCMHWYWDKCPVVWAGMVFPFWVFNIYRHFISCVTNNMAGSFKGKGHKPSVILEAVADRSLYFWHAFFGVPGANNDLVVLDRSPLMQAVEQGRVPRMQYTINGCVRDLPYFLADGIYPAWSIFVNTIPDPTTEKDKHFAVMQEGARKDVERAFGVLQARFQYIKRHSRLWDLDRMRNVMLACIIMHNMMVEEGTVLDLEDEDGNDLVPAIALAPEAFDFNRPDNMDRFLNDKRVIRDRDAHRNLKTDLVEHLWSLRTE